MHRESSSSGSPPDQRQKHDKDIDPDQRQEHAMRANSRRNSERVHVFGDDPITSNTWMHLERDPGLHPRRRCIVLSRLGMICLLVAFTYMSSYIPFTNTVIAAGFVMCTLSLCAGAIIITVREQQREDTSMYSAVPTNLGSDRNRFDSKVNELLSSAELVANARNIAAQRMVERDNDFAVSHLA